MIQFANHDSLILLLRNALKDDSNHELHLKKGQKVICDPNLICDSSFHLRGELRKFVRSQTRKWMALSESVFHPKIPDLRRSGEWQAFIATAVLVLEVVKV